MSRKFSTDKTYNQCTLGINTLLFVSLLLFTLLISSCSLLTTRQAIKTVKAASFVEPQRYAGLWYEIAYLPTYFQIGCRCSMLNYTPLPNNKGIALTTCFKGNHVAVRKALIRPVDGSRYAKHKVQVFWPFQHDYWILYIDKHYRYALTGTPDHKYLWLLSRTPTIPRDIYYNILGLAAKQGYNLRKLRLTKQRCSLPMRRQLITVMRKKSAHHHT